MQRASLLLLFQMNDCLFALNVHGAVYVEMHQIIYLCCVMGLGFTNFADVGMDILSILEVCSVKHNLVVLSMGLT